MDKYDLATNLLIKDCILSYSTAILVVVLGLHFKVWSSERRRSSKFTSRHFSPINTKTASAPSKWFIRIRRRSVAWSSCGKCKWWKSWAFIRISSVFSAALPSHGPYVCCSSTPTTAIWLAFSGNARIASSSPRLVQCLPFLYYIYFERVYLYCSFCKSAGGHHPSIYEPLKLPLAYPLHSKVTGRCAHHMLR